MRESPSSVAVATKASTMSAKYSAGPKARASCAMAGAANVSPMVPSVPATKLPMAAVASAAPARPRRAIWWPSSAVTIVELSPGVFSRIEVVDPPYMPP